MDSGNSHETRKLARAAERLLAKNEPPNKTDAGSTIQAPGASAESSPLQINKPESFVDSISILGFIVAVVAMTVIPPFWPRIILLFLCVPLVFRLAHKSLLTYRWKAIFQNIAAIAAIFVIGLIAVPQLVTQWQSDHPKPALAITALAPNIAYPKGKTISGIEWQDDYAELDVNIRNITTDTIQNVDLTIQVDKGVIFKVGQASDIENVTYNKLLDFPDIKGKMRGANGGSSTVTFDMFGLDKLMPSSRWKVFWPRLSVDDPLKLVIAMSSEEIIGAEAMKIRILGTREPLLGENRRITKVDTWIDVEH